MQLGLFGFAAIATLASTALAEPLPMREVARGIYVFQGSHDEETAWNNGGIANLSFVVGDTAVAVIDTGGTLAHGQRLRGAVRRVTTLPIRYVINTHVHPDHIFGNAAFLADGPDFVGHPKLPRAMEARGNYYLEGLKERLGAASEGTIVVPPSLSMAEQLDLDLGGRVLRVTAHRTAHTDNDLSVYDPATGTLLLGDLLYMERIPVVDGSLTGWLDVMTELREIKAQRVVPGHGPAIADWPEALDAQERYLRLLRDEIRAIIDAGGTIDQAVASAGSSERESWLLFDDYNPRNVVTAFTELEWE